MTAYEALDADYFWCEPMPADPKRYVITLYIDLRLLDRHHTRGPACHGTTTRMSSRLGNGSLRHTLLNTLASQYLGNTSKDTDRSSSRLLRCSLALFSMVVLVLAASTAVVGVEMASFRNSAGTITIRVDIEVLIVHRCP
jgi:hypothetical protein